jgi:hypothetical protein
VYRTFPRDHELRAPWRRQRRRRTKKTLLHERILETQARALLPTGEGCGTFLRGHELCAQQAKAAANGEDVLSRTEYRNTSQVVAANGRRVQDVPPWPRASCTSAQAQAVANGGRSSTHDSQSNKPGRCCQRQKCAERYLVATCFMHHSAGKGGGVQRRRTFTSRVSKH